MTPLQKKKWVKALMSGGYEQGQMTFNPERNPQHLAAAALAVLIASWWLIVGVFSIGGGGL